MRCEYSSPTVVCQRCIACVCLSGQPLCSIAAPPSRIERAIHIQLLLDLVHIRQISVWQGSALYMCPVEQPKLSDVN